MTISTSWTSLTSVRNSRTNATASCTVLCIFQFAAMKGVRMIGVNFEWPMSNAESANAEGANADLFVGQRRDPWQLASAQEFQRRPTSRGDMRDAIRAPGLGDRRDRIAAADHRGPMDRRYRLGDFHRPLGEGVDFEDAHRAVPDDGLRAG